MADAVGGNGGNGKNGNGDSLSVSIGNKAVVVRGALAVVSVFVVAIAGSIFYAGYRVESALEKAEDRRLAAEQSKWDLLREIEHGRSAEHRQIRHAQNVNTCVALYDFSERKFLRQSAGSWEKLCPWLSHPPEEHPSQRMPR